jgi:hypothetical protein
MSAPENQRTIASLRVLADAGKWLVLVVGLYVAAFQVMALVIGGPQSVEEWLGWNRFLFSPGLEYPTAMQFFSAMIALLVAIPVGVWRRVQSRRQRNVH